MLAFLASEVALFSTLIVTYLTLLGNDTVGPTPREALSLPLVIATTCCLLASSATIHKAEACLRLGQMERFHRWWGATIALGITFLLGTAYEWRDLIVDHQLTISRNLFGSAYYTLVGFHGFHVTCGVVTMLRSVGPGFPPPRQSRELCRRRTGVVVLAFRRRCLGDGVPGGVHRREMNRVELPNGEREWGLNPRHPSDAAADGCPAGRFARSGPGGGRRRGQPGHDRRGRVGPGLCGLGIWITCALLPGLGPYARVAGERLELRAPAHSLATPEPGRAAKTRAEASPVIGCGIARSTSTRFQPSARRAGRRH